MPEKIRTRFTTKLMMIMGMILVMPAITYLTSVLIASSSIKQFNSRIIDEYGRSEEEGKAFILEGETKRWIKRISIDVARQMDLFMALHPNLSSRKLGHDTGFREIAVQPVGKRGYTLVVDITSKKFLAHPNDSLEGKDLKAVASAPGLAPIIAQIVDGKFSEGEYYWTEAEGEKDRKYLFATPVPRATKDAHRLTVVATAYMDEIMAPALRRSEGSAIKHILSGIEDRRTRDLLFYSLIASAAMGAILILFSWTLLRKGIAGLKELAHSATEISAGNFDVRIKKITSDEFGALADAFNRMATLLKETVISKNYYEDAKIKAERAGRLRGEFLANISHGIRTPLNGIIGFSDILLEEKTLPEQKMEYLRHIKRCGHKLSTLFNDVLELSKIEAGKIVLAITPVDIRSLAGGVVAMFEHICSERKISFSVSIDSLMPEAINTDSSRLRQVLINLLDNAVKFTDHGVISLSISPYRGNRKGNTFFSVRDTGVGIASERHDFVLDGFTRSEGARTQLKDGAGVGLAISADLVSVLGGEIWFESEPGKGSTFSFTIDG